MRRVNFFLHSLARGLVSERYRVGNASKFFVAPPARLLWSRNKRDQTASKKHQLAKKMAHRHITCAHHNNRRVGRQKWPSPNSRPRWRLSREINQRARSISSMVELLSKNQHSICNECREFTCFAAEIGPPNQIRRLPQKDALGVYLFRHSFQTPTQPYRSFYLVHGWNLMWWFEGKLSWVSRIRSRRPQNVVGKRKIRYSWYVSCCGPRDQDFII